MTDGRTRRADLDAQAAEPAVATWHVQDELGTQRLAAALATCLPTGAVVMLSGTLGAGKTRFVQFFAAAVGIDASIVNSPTFVLCQHYQGDRAIVHLDVYRVQDDDEFLNLGPDELFASSDVTFIEWGERVRGCLPESCYQLSIEVTGADARAFTLRATPDVIQCIESRLVAADEV